MRIYVGDEPRQAILGGNVKRGQVSTIRSAILFADMRDSTQQTVELGAVGAVELFNSFFDCLVPAIEQRHGEVLKYLGDGLSAIFREAKDGDSDAPERALAAARDSLASLNAFNTEHPTGRRCAPASPCTTGGRLWQYRFRHAPRFHRDRARCEPREPNRRHEPHARRAAPLSAAFARELGQKVTPLGKFPAKGFVDPVEIFRPDVIDVTLDRVYRTPKTTFFDIG